MSRMEALTTPPSPPTRHTSAVLDQTPSTPSFIIDAKNKSYKHQYSNIYFTRLTMLKKPVFERAMARWKDLKGSPVCVPRVLDVVKSQLCWVLGTVYMDMPLKPNHSLPPPPPREKFYSDEDSIMLEDESGRIKLVGDRLKSTRLVTGVIMAALGMETPSGDFEVIDTCSADLAPFAEVVSTNDDSMDVDSSSTAHRDEYLAVVSGLSIGAESPADAQIQMLVEYLSGEAGGRDDQMLASQITRLVIAGNSLSSVPDGENGDEEENKKSKKFGAAIQPNFSPHPNSTLSAHLQDLVSALPVHILPGTDDPSGAILPQQPFPRAMFGRAASFETFYCETNPAWIRVRCGTDLGTSTLEGVGPSASMIGRSPVTRSLLVTSGQPVLDMYKYFPHTAFHARGDIIAPTAPDTLWCHPYRERDPFVLKETPDIYIIGGMAKFDTALVGPEHGGEKKALRRCRVVLVPSFSETGVLVLINMRTLDVRRMSMGGPESPKEDQDAMQEG
ncbi:DNA polymerase alpha/epsilon subunit B-domain-containing protein [Melanogaster broomeanus]|nr:DNA polymerase alpha/epsilon subunit B-domain-containing protein [Melanogaster broomeanus]